MDGEEDEMTRDEMRYLLRGGVVLYYFPFFLGRGKGFFLVNTSIKKIQLKYHMMISSNSDLIFFAIQFSLFSKKKHLVIISRYV